MAHKKIKKLLVCQCKAPIIQLWKVNLARLQLLRKLFWACGHLRLMLLVQKKYSKFNFPICMPGQVVLSFNGSLWHAHAEMEQDENFYSNTLLYGHVALIYMWHAQEISFWCFSVFARKLFGSAITVSFHSLDSGRTLKFNWIIRRIELKNGNEMIKTKHAFINRSAPG